MQLLSVATRSPLSKTGNQSVNDEHQLKVWSTLYVSATALNRHSSTDSRTYEGCSVSVEDYSRSLSRNCARLLPIWPAAIKCDKQKTRGQPHKITRLVTSLLMTHTMYTTRGYKLHEGERVLSQVFWDITLFPLVNRSVV
jgi:hypothetical protein